MQILWAAKIPVALVASLVIVLAAASARASEAGKIDAPRLSGTYSFRALVRGRHHSCAEHGDLEFDWLGDVSGQAMARPGAHRAGDATRCNLLISGTYSSTAKRGVYTAEVTLMPLSPNFPIDDGREETLKMKIVPRDRRGDLDLLASARSRQKFVGEARLQSRGPS